MSEPTAPSPPPTEPEAPVAPPRRGPWGIVRGIAARYIRFVVRHRFLGCLGSLLLLFFLCAAISLVAARLTPEEEERAALVEVETNQIGSVLNEPVEPVESYIAAMMAFDAQGMWAAYNEEARTQLAARGGSAEQLQQGLDQARGAGARYTGAVRIGNYPLRDGRRYVFYILSRTGFPPSGGDEEVYFIFTVDPDGRILNVT